MPQVYSQKLLLLNYHVQDGLSSYGSTFRVVREYREDEEGDIFREKYCIIISICYNFLRKLLD